MLVSFRKVLFIHQNYIIMALKKIRIQWKARKNKKLSNEEVEFLIANGDDFVLNRYFMFNSLPERLHLALMNRDECVINTYIRYRPLSQEAEMELFTRQKSLVKNYLQNHCPSVAAQKELLKPENQGSLEEFIEIYDLDDNLIVEFMKTAPDYIVMQYVKEHEFSCEAFSELLNRSSLLAQFHAEEFTLDEESEVLYIKKASPEQIDKYVEGVEILSSEGELALINTGYVEIIAKYIRLHNLGDYHENEDNPQELALLHLGNKELLLIYVKWHKPCKNFVIELLKSGDKDVIMALISAQVIPVEAQDMLFGLGREFVECYIAHSPLGVNAEKKLFDTFPADVLKAYIENFGLGNNLQGDLIRKGDEDLIRFCIDQQDFCVEAQEILVKTLNKDLISYYNKKRGFDDSVWKLIAQTFFFNNL